MSSPREKLASSLSALSALQSQGIRVFQSNMFTRTHRERLIKHGYLEVICKGWLVSSNPSAANGDTTPWFSSFWEFFSAYCTFRFQDNWNLSPQLSLDFHAEKCKVPAQVIVFSTAAQNNLISLPHNTSIYVLKQKNAPPATSLTTQLGLRVYTIEAALVEVPEAYYRQSPVEAEVALIGIADPSVLLHHLLQGGHSKVAGRLAGAFRRLQRSAIADEILRTMGSAGYDVRESDPFKTERPMAAIRHAPSPPITSRLQRLWVSARQAVLSTFPDPPIVRPDAQTYLATIDDVYHHDAYHSLSIEGYQVTEELIRRVATGAWDSEDAAAKSKDSDALAARGYYQAFRLVREIVADGYTHESPPDIRGQHRYWYRELFSPNVTAGMLEPTMLAGYRRMPVYLKGSRHMPPRWDVLEYAMPTLFDLIDDEPHPGVRAVLAHWLIGYVHPFPDGNGRIARFTMNVLLASAGYPWTVIQVQDRQDYLRGLEAASVGDDLGPFAAFIAQQMERTASLGATSGYAFDG